jgi:hypothetical protein
VGEAIVHEVIDMQGAQNSMMNYMPNVTDSNWKEGNTVLPLRNHVLFCKREKNCQCSRI